MPLSHQSTATWLGRWCELNVKSLSTSQKFASIKQADFSSAPRSIQTSQSINILSKSSFYLSKYKIDRIKWVDGGEVVEVGEVG
jgi:hypothetical protein